jgi:hypothetical protein
MVDSPVNDNIAAATPLYIGRCAMSKGRKVRVRYVISMQFILIAVVSTLCLFVKTSSHKIAFHKRIYTTNNA